jgi:hypothetical protein
VRFCDDRVVKRTLFLVALATLAACSTPSPQRATPDALSQRCTNTRYGISISYPAGWQTNDGSLLPACSAFDPTPIDIPRDSEIPFDIAVVLDVEQVPLEQFTRSSSFQRVLAATPMTIAGRNASRVEVEADGDRLADRGLRTLRYVIDLGAGRTLIASTHATDGSYEQKKEILGRMMESVKVE